MKQVYDRSDDMNYGGCGRVAAVLLGAWIAATGLAAAQATAQVNRASRDTWTPVMEVLKTTRNVTVTDAQVQRLRELPLERSGARFRENDTSAPSRGASSRPSLAQSS
jgi:hypothetical protein